METPIDTTMLKETISTYEILKRLNLEDKITANLKALDESDEVMLFWHIITYKTLWIEIYGIKKFYDIKRMFEKITLRKPRDEMTLFFLNNYDKFERNIDFETLKRKITDLWEHTSLEERNKYKVEQIKEEDIYHNELELIKGFIYFGINVLELKKINIKYFDELLLRNDLVLNDIYYPDKIIRQIIDSEPKTDEMKLYLYKVLFKNRDYMIEALKVYDKTPFYFFKLNKKIICKASQKEMPNELQLKKEWENLDTNSKLRFEAKSEEYKNENELLYKLGFLLTSLKLPKPPKPFKLFWYDLDIFNQKYGKTNLYDKINLWNKLNKKIKDQYEFKYKISWLVYKYNNTMIEKKEEKNLNANESESKKEEISDDDDKIKEMEKKMGYKILTEEEKNNVENLEDLRELLYKKDNNYEINVPKNVPSDFNNFINANKDLIYKVKNDLGLNSDLLSAKILYDGLKDKKNK